MNLKEIKNNFCPYDENYCLAEEEVRWLIEQAEKVEQYEKAVKQTIEKMNGYDLHRFGDELQEVLKA